MHVGFPLVAAEEPVSSGAGFHGSRNVASVWSLSEKHFIRAHADFSFLASPGLSSRVVPDFHLAVFPRLLIMLAVLGFNAMGDAIRDILDPRMLSRVRGGRAG